jgi:hypothetical protein
MGDPKLTLIRKKDYMVCFITKNSPIYEIKPTVVYQSAAAAKPVPAKPAELHDDVLYQLKDLQFELASASATVGKVIDRLEGTIR